ncbi:hypothetical protein NC653_000647 [Populus alba x Populus x berolinensis]|uniref:Uncharacterized protein n=1 Tax=Populus alba x Populus x berolinensis TaxID=444605 RepID=A0AAD6WFL3_9ROSI|nr:hypothetical protein NC653_000647 [Populus alba x Populus x berolinensis]
MLPQVQRPNRKSSPLATVTAAAAGQVELAELDGPFVVISLKGRFWHERSMEILEVEIEDEKQLDDSPENF